jgi:hypothetical protein
LHLHHAHGTQRLLGFDLGFDLGDDGAPGEEVGKGDLEVPQ